MPIEAVNRYSGAKGDLIVSGPDCHDCSGCVAICPYDAMSLHAGVIAVDMDACTLCTLCTRVCPTGAIAIERAPKVGA